MQKSSPVSLCRSLVSIVGYADINFDQETLPQTALEVTRNYQLALTKAGPTLRFSSEQEKCGGSSRSQQPFVDYADGMRQLRRYGGFEDLGFVVGHTDNVGTLEANQTLSQQRAAETRQLR